MKKKNNLIAGMLTAALAIGLTGCGNMAYTGDTEPKTTQGNFVLTDVMDAVTLPNQYLISYEIQSADGIIASMTKGVDENDNVYFADSSGEVLFVSENGRYIVADDLESEHAEAYTPVYVEQITAPFMEYAENAVQWRCELNR